MKRCLTRLRCAMALKFPGQEAMEKENLSEFNKNRQCDVLEFSRTKHCKYDVMKRCLKCPCQKMRVCIFQIYNKKYKETRKQNQNCYFALKVIAVRTLDLAFRKV